MGSDAIALPALNWLAGEGSRVAQVIGVFTQPDRAAGRGQKITPNAIKLWALARRLPVLQPAKVGAAERQQLAGLKPDVTLVMAYGHILSQEVIDTPRLGTLNLHTSVLPKYRGASPIQTAITCAETETGVTLMRMVRKLDAGPVADGEHVKIDPLDTAAEVEARLATACVPLLARCLRGIAAGTQAFVAQNESLASYCRRLEKKDGVLDFELPARLLAGRINGLMPWPGCSVEISGQSVKLGLADICSLLDHKPTGAGAVVGVDAEGLLVETGQGILRLRKLQRPGGKMLPAAEFLHGFPVATGTRLASRPMPPLVAPEPFLRPKV
ncbi:MAG: methionyl-tRNA formyltransferase [Lacunisphaera sp.]|nr:methionyl-tRNA formyltransferase [Lacunisphaera sp.]